MRNFYFILFLLLSQIVRSHGQGKMIVNNEDWTAYTYQKFSYNVSSINKLPNNIQQVVKFLLNDIFWDLKDSLHFVSAQVIDIKSHLKSNIQYFGKLSVIPKYELNFYLKDLSIGIHRYNVVLYLDDYGQILELNWPREYGGSKQSFLDRGLISKFILSEATRRGYALDNYLVNFDYDPQYSRLCWTFSFLSRSIVGGGVYDFIKVPWDELTIIESTRIINN